MNEKMTAMLNQIDALLNQAFPPSGELYQAATWLFEQVQRQATEIDRLQAELAALRSTPPAAPPLTAAEIDLLIAMQAYDEPESRAMKTPGRSAALVSLQKRGYLFTYDRDSEWRYIGNTWTLSEKGRDIAQEHDTDDKSIPVAPLTPAPVRLTVSQYKALDILSKVDVAYIGNSNHLMPSLAEDGTFWGKVYANTAKVLLTQGLAKRVSLTSIAITDLGRAALTANGARHDD